MKIGELTNNQIKAMLENDKAAMWLIDHHPELLRNVAPDWMAKNAPYDLIQVAFKPSTNDETKKLFVSLLVAHDSKFIFELLMKRSDKYLTENFPHYVMKYNPDYMVEKDINWVVKNYPELACKEYPEKVFIVDPNLVVKYNPDYVNKCRLTWLRDNCPNMIDIPDDIVQIINVSSKQTVSLYSETLTNEIKELIKKCNLNCTVEEFEDKVDWVWISEYQNLSEEFIEEFQDKVDWDWISRYQKLSEEFIEKHQDKIDWDYISQYQKLSEEFIDKFQDKVYWDWILQFQKLSPEFSEKWKHKLK